MQYRLIKEFVNEEDATGSARGTLISHLTLFFANVNMYVMPKSKKVAPSDVNFTMFLLLVFVVIVAGLIFYRKKVFDYQKYLSKVNVLRNTKVATIAVSDVNSSGEWGTLTLTESQGKLKVELNLTGFPENISQPAHIHTGSCTNYGDIVYPLDNVLNGKSTTYLDTNFDSLMAMESLVVNVHKSVPEVSTVFSCSDLNIN